MSNLTNVADIVPDSDISPTSLNASGVESSFTGKSFTVLTRPSTTDEGTGPGDNMTPRYVNPLPSFQLGGWRHSTPPPEETPVTQSQLVTGAGGLFPSLPPSRASSLSSLTVGSEASSEGPSTPSRGVRANGTGDSDDLTTPIAMDKTAGGEFLFSLGNMWTPPDSTPKRQGKRNRSPPPSPRPPKVARFDIFQMPNLLEDDEGYSEELPRELNNQQIFRNAQNRLLALAEFRPGSPSSQADIFGNPLVEDSDTVGENGSVVAAIDSEDLLRSDSIGTSVHCHYGQDEFVIEVEWFTEDEIESQLSEHLGSYRAAYLGLDEPGQGEETASAEAARGTFRVMSAGRVNWGELETILEEEDEDVMDVFMGWVRDMKIPDKVQSETFLDINACLGYLKRLTILPKSDSEIKAWSFIRKIKLSSNGCIDRFLDNLPEVRGVNATSLSFDGAIEWEFDEIYSCLGEKDVGELVAAWDNLMIRDE